MTARNESQTPEVRRLAALLLRQCLDRKLTVEEAIAGSPQAALLDARDRALLSTLLLTSFRHRGEIDAVLRKLLDKPLPRRSGGARDILAIGVAQLLFLAMPAHAVIDLAVRSAKADRNALHFSGLVNAVLRKVAAEAGTLLTDLDAPHLNTPDWLWARWSKNYGEEGARRIAQAQAERPGLDISFRETPSDWQATLGGSILANGQVRIPPDHASVTELPGFAEGAWWVQDAAATIPARLLGDVRGKAVLDLCAAPGGKSLQLAAMGARVTAVDMSRQRLRRLQDNLSRTRLAADIVVGDVLTAELPGAWDAVLLDAPCTATGTIRRHPELPYLKSEDQVKDLAALQRRMLRRAAELVRPGGTLVYCTCSLEPEEGESQARNILFRHGSFEIIRAEGDWLPESSVRPEGWVRTLPFMSYGESAGMDGFFAVAMRRKA